MKQVLKKVKAVDTKCVYMVYAKYKNGNLRYLGTFMDSIKDIVKCLGNDEYEIVAYKHNLGKLYKGDVYGGETNVTVIEEIPMEFRPNNDVSALVQNVMCECDFLYSEHVSACSHDFSLVVKEG